MIRCDLLLFFSLVIIIVGCADHYHGRQSNLPAITIIAMGDMRGELLPCGCDGEKKKGGLPRRASYFEHQRKNSQMLYFDLGNNFPEFPSEQGKLKIDLWQNNLRQLKPSAILPGPTEVAYGLRFLPEDLPYLLSNCQENLLKKHITVDINNHRLGVLGYLSPLMVHQSRHESFQLQKARNSLLTQWQHLAELKWDSMVLLFRGNEKELSFFAESKMFALIITGNNNEETTSKVKMVADGVEFPSVPVRGIGALRMAFSNSGKYDVDWLEETYNDHPQMVKNLAEYDRLVAELYNKKAEKAALARKNSPYVGGKTCSDCHEQEQQTWLKSRHHNAFATLKKVGKHFDPQCIICHVVGFEDNGFISPKLTPELYNVQCENCHGPGKTHVENPEVKLPHTPAKNRCKTCHKGKHSPQFDYQVYWPKIKH